MRRNGFVLEMIHARVARASRSPSRVSRSRRATEDGVERARARETTTANDASSRGVKCVRHARRPHEHVGRNHLSCAHTSTRARDGARVWDRGDAWDAGDARARA